jgi:SagB-type dehydrogenase family enzyme
LGGGCFSAAALLGACDSRSSQRSAPPSPPPLRRLNEIPIPQLRVFLKGYAGGWQADSDRSQDRPEPPDEKPVPAGARIIPLVPRAEIHLGDLSVREAIAGRRSRRDFSDAELTQEELSFLLWATQGITGELRDEKGEVTERFRAAPSGGARYPLETYLAVHRVKDLAPGLYRYVPSQHALMLVREDAEIPQKLQGACYGSASVGQAAVVFLWSAVPYRTEWKYTYLSHRMIAMEAGHVCENLYLAAESCGTGCCAMLSYDQPHVDALLGLDGEDEFTLYLACVGKPKPE